MATSRRRSVSEIHDAEVGALFSERSLFTIGFYVGLGFFVAWALFAVVVLIAVLAFIR